MPTPTYCKPRKPRPNIRARLLAVRADILAHAVRVEAYVLGPDGDRTPCTDYAQARLSAFARSWGDMGREYSAIERVTDARGRCVSRNHERFFVEVMP